MQESQYRMTALPNDVGRMETLIHDHDANKPTVLELFKFSNTEAQSLINKINEAVSIFLYSLRSDYVYHTFVFHVISKNELKIVIYLHIILQF